MNNKISLILEGGGIRGAYTAGCLNWLIDNNVLFNNGYAISSGAVLLTMYALKDSELLKTTATDIFTSKDVVGIKPLFKEGNFVAMNYLFKDLFVNTYKIDFDKLKNTDFKVNLGVYDLELGKTVFYQNSEINFDILKAAISLPIVSEVTVYNGKKIMDGGITKMIPIEASIEDGNLKHLVICTKYQGYVRKKSSKFVEFLMKLIYNKYPKLVANYLIRKENYDKQMEIVEDLVKQNQAILIRPSKKFKIERFSGEKSKILEFYQLGYDDMERRKDEILSFIK